MSIIMENSEGVLIESYKGQVIRLIENNGYHDSDFFAIVWDLESNNFKRIEYASTRGGSYKNNAFVDATPEILELVKARQAKNRAEDQAEKDALLSIQVEKGKIVEFIGLEKKKAFLNNLQGEVFWIGAGFGYGSTMRVGVKVDEKKYFVDLNNVKVVGSEVDGSMAKIKLNSHYKVAGVFASHYGSYYY
jgi:hypothetical protein